MAKHSTPPAYRKLTRIRRGLGTVTQMWLGRDHLLHVTSTGFTENYRRFYLRDIQTILIVHTGVRTYVAVALALLLAGSLAIVNEANGGSLAYGIVSGIFLAFLFWNHWLGSGCRVVIISAVQQENVPSFGRLPRTRRVLAELKPLIEAAQADLGPGPVSAGAEIPPTTAAEPVPSRAPVSPPPLPPPGSRS